MVVQLCTQRVKRTRSEIVLHFAGVDIALTQFASGMKLIGDW